MIAREILTATAAALSARLAQAYPDEQHRVLVQRDDHVDQPAISAGVWWTREEVLPLSTGPEPSTTVVATLTVSVSRASPQAQDPYTAIDLGDLVRQVVHSVISSIQIDRENAPAIVFLTGDVASATTIYGSSLQRASASYEARVRLTRSWGE